MKASKKWLHFVQLLTFICLAGTVSAQLTANFSATPVSGCPPLLVNFQDLSTGNPTSWRWDLGNGTQSFVANPLGTYFDPGTYTVKLVVRNSNNDADSIVRTQYIVVHALPVVSFSASDTTGCYPLRVQFTNNSVAGSGTVSNWQWDFGDGSLSSLQNPSHTYTNSGNFAVTLRVTNSNGCSRVMSKPSYIETADGVKSNFIFTSAQGCQPPTPVTFTNTSTGSGVLSYQWSFGDGNTSTATNPVHNYVMPGSYTVRLITINNNGCTDTIIKPNAIIIGSVQASFNRPDSICVGRGATFTNTSVPSAVSATWNFGDGTTSTANNPVKAFAAAGVYQVKMVNNFGACFDSVTRTITVLDKPVASFTASNTISCSAPLMVSFTNTSTGGTLYNWNFGDGSTSTVANPVKNYTRAGKFTVTLIVRNNQGCSDTLRMTGMVNIAPPRITSISNLNVRGCTPLVVSPVANITSEFPVTSYLWNFGDGTTSTLATPTHTYTVPGIYNVKLVVSSGVGCTDSMTVNAAVTVGDKPNANFSATPRDVCAAAPIEFTDLSTGLPLHSWFWEFGDGGTSTLQNPKHNYGDTGYFNVTLVVFSFGCADTLVLNNYVYIRPPMANFDTAFSCAEPLTRHFIDKSLLPETWFWDFGDGATSTLQNPSHTYAAPGEYKVTLRVTNGSCFSESERNVIVIQENATLNASDTVGCRNTRVVFDAVNVNAANIQSYSWYFEGINNAPVNGSTATRANIYAQAGSYNTALVITDILGCKDTVYKTTPVIIYGPKAGFSANTVGTCFNSIITFTDTTKTDGTHPLVNWVWDYGDGTIQQYTSAPFVHAYANNGLYGVKMVVEDSYGCKDSIMKPSYVTISKPVASFSMSDTLICPSAAVNFTNTSVGGYNVNYLWHFGDGNMATDVNPVYSYTTQGSFVVKMVMTDMFGCSDSTEKTIEVYTPSAGFAMSDSFSSCPPLLVDFTNSSAHYVQQNWDFGDGSNSQLVNPSRMYTYPGTYHVRLTVTNNGGCIDTISKTINIQGPTGIFSYDPLKICTAGEITFTASTQNTVNYIWDFNDGNIDFTNQPTASHTYAVAGNYIPKIILEDATGCKVPILGLDTIKVLGVETHILAQPRLLCDSGMVNFTDSTISNDPVAGYQWNFGDGNTSVAFSPSHTYRGAAWYNVQLITTTQFGCADTVVYNNYIKVVSSPSITILGDTAACEPLQLTFRGASVVPDTSVLNWSWTFGNGFSSASQNPAPQSYPSAGSFPVQLTVTNSDGCVSVVGTTAILHPIPVVDAGMDTTICRFESYTLSPSGANEYAWTAHPTLSCVNCTTPVATPPVKQVYYVKGTSAFGCTNTDSVVINVKQPITITVSKNDTLCMGETKQLLASGAEIYNWTPALWLDNTGIANPKSKPDSTITYKVTGTDDQNCFSDSGFVTLRVFPIPRIEILNGDVITLMVGSSIKLNTLSSPDVTNWRWMTSLGLSCTTCPEPVAAPKQNTTYAVLASNDGKCIARDQVTINLICDNANIYIPNTFSPNGDGMNDVFYPRGTGLYTIKTMRIFNRWGQLVFEKNNVAPNSPSQGWDGNHNGTKAQSDVYVYVMEAICDNNTVVPIKGNITLLR